MATPQKGTTQHTPGPWSMEYDDGVWISGPDKNANVLCDIIGRIDDREAGTQITDEDLANARLIAAAPDLLEALRDLFQAEIEQADHILLELAIEKARTAITKAAGA